MTNRGQQNKSMRNEGGSASNFWWNLPKWHDHYEKGLDEYLNDVCSKAPGNQIACLCKECDYRYWFSRDEVKGHLLQKGFSPRAEKQFDKQPDLGQDENRGNDSTADDPIMDVNIAVNELLGDLRKGPDEDTNKFYKLVEDGQQELYPGCKAFSKLSFTIRLFLFKIDHKLSNVAFTELLELLGEVLPDAKLPASFNEAKNVVKVLGLDYVKIDACPNDCMIYWEENAQATSCHVCNTSRWKHVDNDDDDAEVSLKLHRIPAKVLRYFPIKKRLQRLFLCPETAQQMRWHAERNRKDGVLRHISDGEAWKEFDSINHEFAADPRNVRLGLATDGFSPFNNMSLVHSTWPVMLINFNLPSELCMKPEFLILVLLVPGPYSPGNELDIYLQPLIKDLNELWRDGVETYDVITETRFDMHAALVSTVSDFPGYAMVSGWSTKGKKACPCCHYETSSTSLTCSSKVVYLEHRRFLDMDHPWRFDLKKFDGVVEDRMAPVRLRGTEVEELLSDFRNEFGKLRRITRGPDVPWRKVPILFTLPYWKHNRCGHSLDVMHIEKNVFDNVLNTLLDVPGKTKDHVNARKDLVLLNKMPDLQIKDVGGSYVMPRSRFWMSIQDKRRFCQVFKNAKLPYGSASNIARCVKVQERRIVGYKSHDAHFMMQNLLPVAAMITLPKDVALPLIKLGSFFKSIYSKQIKCCDLKKLQKQIAETLSELETIFPPTFFDIMEHLTVHLVEEISLGGPVTARMMYPIERYLRKLKSNTRNKSRPEASMAEAQLLEECVAFCARYLKKPITVTKENDDGENSSAIFSGSGHSVKGRGRKGRRNRDLFRIDCRTRSQAHRYILFNCDSEEVEKYIKEHKTLVSNRRKRKWDVAQDHSKVFSEWFQEKVTSEIQQGCELPDLVRWLSVGPSYVARRHTGYSINGYRFHTMKRDANLVTQNSGVTLMALTPSFASTSDQNPITGEVNYYGLIEEILEIYYHGISNGVVLFRCNWFHSVKDSLGLISINRRKAVSKQDPFILASQARLVFYIEDPKRTGWHYAVEMEPRGIFDEEECDG